MRELDGSYLTSEAASFHFEDAAASLLNLQTMRP